jgi:hypothetical protein
MHGEMVLVDMVDMEWVMVDTEWVMVDTEWVMVDMGKLRNNGL